MWWAKFATTIPDDTVEDEVDVLQTGGQSVAEALGQLLSRVGYRAEAPIYEGLKGWTIDVIRARQRFTIQVSRVDEVWLLIGPRLRARFGIRDRAADRLLLEIDDALRGDDRFSAPIWEKSEPSGRVLATFDGPPEP